MLSLNVRTNVVRLARNLVNDMFDDSYNWRHFSFIIRKSQIYSIGVNRPFKTHPLAQKFNYKFQSIHSELNCILKFDGPPAKLYKYTMVNIRLNRRNELRISKPCQQCQLLLASFNINDIWFSKDDGSFENLI